MPRGTRVRRPSSEGSGDCCSELVPVRGQGWRTLDKFGRVQFDRWCNCRPAQDDPY